MREFKKNEYDSSNLSSGETFYFHDYETFGIDPKVSQASQFAGIRTDKNLNIIDGSELNIYCQVRDDQLPSPMACLVTKLTPKRINQQNPEVVYSEYEFTKRILSEMTKPNTCNIGYNNISFDDEWSRNLSHRNFLDPYEREWKNGCSRADGLMFIQVVYLYNPNVINFPQAKDESGNLLFDDNNNPIPSFKLEELSSANGIIHENAHDALSDVIALIGLLKIIKEKDPFIFDFILELKNKNKVSGDLTLYKNKLKPFLHISSFYGKKNKSCSVVVPIGNDPNNKNNVYVFDLKCDPKDLLKPVSEIAENLFSKKEELVDKGEDRVGIKSFALNKFTPFLPLEIIKNRTEYIGIKENSELYKENLSKLKIILDNENIQEKLNLIFNNEFDRVNDPDMSLYGGFPTKTDSKIKEQIHFNINNGNLDSFNLSFQDNRLDELMIRFKARNFPDLLSSEEVNYWENFIYNKLFGDSVEAEYKYNQYVEEINNLWKINRGNSEKLKILEELKEFGDYIKNKYLNK